MLVVLPVLTVTLSVPRRHLLPSFHSRDGCEVCTVSLRVAQTATEGMDHTGMVVWDGSKHLARLIVEAPELLGGDGPLHPFHGKAVLELGAGVTGLPSMAAHVCGASSVVVTDKDEELEPLWDNLHRNLCEGARAGASAPECGRVCCSDLCPLTSGAVSVRRCVWGDPVDADVACRHFDFVIAADVLYEGTLEPLLAVVMDSLVVTAPDSHGVSGGSWTAQRLVMVNSSRVAVHKFHRRLIATNCFAVLTVVLPWAGPSDVAWVIERTRS
jgi:predicted nicotinamide N-methyase